MVTIIVAVYNCAKTLQRCIDSVKQQSYSNTELIIIDGGSTDGTVEILEHNDSSIEYWESKPDRGISDAWNKGLTHANGDWILFLGGDDFIWKKHSLECIIPLINEADETYRIIYGHIAFVDSAENILSIRGKPWEQVKKRFRTLEMSIPHQGVFHHESLFRRYGNFDINFKLIGDYEFLLRELKNNDALFIDQTVTAMGYGGLSTKGNIRHKFYAEFVRAHQKHQIKNGLDRRYFWRYWNIFKGKVKHHLFRDKHF